MTKKKFRIGIQLLCILLVLVITLSAYVAGKYTTQIKFSGSVTFTSSLAANMVLQEHQAVRQSDGSYTLTDTVVQENTYILMPGVDIPKDLHIVITGKTPVDAYLFITIDAPAYVTCQVDETLWARVENPNDGKVVYYYKGTLEENPATPQTIYIFAGGKDATVQISHTLLGSVEAGAENAGLIQITALLKEYFGDTTPKDVYDR